MKRLKQPRMFCIWLAGMALAVALGIVLGALLSLFIIRQFIL